MVNVQKHKLLLFLLLCTITGIFTACTNDTESIGNHNGTPLFINVGVDTPQSRAVITGNSLLDGSQIGVSVVDASGTDYQDQDYNNVCYQAVTEDGTQKWKVQSRSDILLSGEAGTLYAYYPWTAAATDFTQIAVNMDEVDQKDWMVAEPITNLSDAQATAAVKMKHMLTNFKLSFYKDNYSGKGEVTAVTIRSNAFATTGTLDATTGTFAAYGDGHTLTRTFTTTLGTDKTAAAACNVMVVPNTVAAPVTISVTVDGNTYSSVTSSLTLEKAKSYNYSMKLSSTGLNITEVTLTDWQTTDLGNTDFEPVRSWNNLADGVYAVSTEGSPVDVANADASCVAVALIVNDAQTPQKLMIAKADATDGTNNTLHWTKNKSDLSLTNYTNVDGTNSYGYLPKPDGSYQSTPNLSGDFTTWTAGALSDFNGKANTAAITAASSDTRDMCTVLNTFNASDSHDDWYVPACGQLALMYLNKTEINEALEKIDGGAIVDEYYWSSTEYSSNFGWHIYFGNGGTTHGDNFKDYFCRVRFIRDIE